MNNIPLIALILVLSSFLLDNTDCFTPLSNPTNTPQRIRQQSHTSSTTTALNEKKKKKNKSSNSTPPPKGFGSTTGNNNNNTDKAKITVTKTYDINSESINADEGSGGESDSEDVVRSFFERRDDFRPLFQSLLSAAMESDFYSPPLPFAVDLLTVDADLTPSSSSSSSSSPLDESIWEVPEGGGSNPNPWKKLPALPTDQADLAIVGGFLDAAQQALTDIPVKERAEDDENDLHFIEEGRRCLVMSRFQVLGGGAGAAAAAVDSATTTAAAVTEDNDDDENENELFAVCWSEIALLMQEDQTDTGSLIALPEEVYGGENMGSLKRFAEREVRRPLDWLGLGDTFEVASLQRGSPAIRLIHKLSDIPKPEREKDEEGEKEDEEE